MTNDSMLMCLRRREEYLARRVADADEVGRNLMWDRDELLALRQAIALLTNKKAPEPCGAPPGGGAAVSRAGGQRSDKAGRNRRGRGA